MSLRARLVLLSLIVVAATALATVAASAVAFGSLEILPASAAAAAHGRTVEAPQTRWRSPDLALVAIAAAGAAAIVAVPAVIAAILLARAAEGPLAETAAAVEAIAAGDLGRPVAIAGPGEGRLGAAVTAVRDSLAGIVDRIRASGRRLAAVEADTSSALAGQERTAEGFSAATQEISASVAEITATSEQLLAATGGVMDVAREAAAVADEGREDLARMTLSMQQLDEAMNAFTRKLATISQRASGITAVVTTIAKVAEQTNLLSVNATIEAEKAGESGRGFRIVAQEIRRLADQTALATKDIERMVRDMQAAVAGGTMEMDRFRNQVSGRVGEVAEVSEKLGRVIEPVQSVTRALAEVHESMQAQSLGARQIRASMESLRADAAESATAVAVFAAALAELRAASAELAAEADRFG